MNLRTGIDLLEIERLQAVLQRHGERFLARIYTPLEREQCAGNLPSLAARFTAKEAAAKALGCGIGDVGWQEIEVLRDEHGAPLLHLHGAAQQRATELGLTLWSVSLSHTQQHAIAMVTAIG
ncbi:MAG: holo-ACP synthase [Anaerolineales bacterium]